MECYRVHIPIGTRVAGATAHGEATFVLRGSMWFIGSSRSCRHSSLPYSALLAQTLLVVTFTWL